MPIPPFNHLGNVLATVSDQRQQHSTDNSTVDYYIASVITAQDYYPFGMLMPGRKGHSSVDGNGNYTWNDGNNSVAANLSYNQPRAMGDQAEYKATHQIEFMPGFMSGDGNDYFIAHIVGGSGGSGSGSGSGPDDVVSGYRYGFNGKENDNDIQGEGDEQDYGMRIYDTRLGRFLSVDPITKSYPELTPYQFASDRPIDGIDLDGLEFFDPDKHKGKKSLYIMASFSADPRTLQPGDVYKRDVENYERLTGRDINGKKVTSGLNDFRYDPGNGDNTEMQQPVDPSSDQEANRGWRNKNGNGDIATVWSEVVSWTKVAAAAYVEVRYKEDFEYHRESAIALSNAYLLTQAAAKNPTFQSYLKSKGFLRDVTNYMTDGTLPSKLENSPDYIDLVSIWGQLLLSPDYQSVTLSKMNFNFSENSYITHIIPLNKNDGWINKLIIPIPNSNKQVLDALEKAKNYEKNNSQIESDEENVSQNYY